MLVTKGERMRKLCDKNCETCELDECVMKHPPFDWSASEKQRTEISKEQRRNYVKRKRELCVAFGICRECLCREATQNKYCLECFVKMRKRNNARRKDIHRAERISYGLCYFCGKPTEEGFKTCKEHHRMQAEKILKTNYQDNSEHIWRKLDRLIFVKRKA